MDIRSKVMSALRWTAAARLLGQVISWAITIVVIRILTPEDYGLMAMGTVVASFLFLLNTLGLDAILVQEKELGEQTRRQIFGVVIVMNLLWFLLLIFGAGEIAEFFNEPALAAVLRVMALQFLVLAFETLPQAQLEREIDFARRSVVDLVTLILGSLLMLVLALLGYGVWALVWGMVANSALRVLGLNLITRALVWPSFSMRGMAPRFSFGAFVSTDRGLWYLFSESDKFIGGKLLGSQGLGYYAVASQLAALPIYKLAGLLNSVAFPAFSKAHAVETDSRVHEYLLTATRILSLAAFPVFLGISCTAEAIITALLGEKWVPAAPLLQLLALIMPLRLLNNVFAPLLWGIGKPQVSAVNNAISALLLPLALAAGAYSGGVQGMAFAWLLAYPPVFALISWRSCSRVGLRLGQYLAQMARPLIACIAMYLVVLGVDAAAGQGMFPWGRLAVLVTAGAVTYALAMLAIGRAELRETLALLRS